MWISDFFYIVIFLSMIGSAACVFLLFTEKVMRLALPFYMYPSTAIFFVVPLVVPATKLFYFDSIRIEAFNIASLVWLTGFGVIVLLMFVRFLITYRTISQYIGCTDNRILALYDECIKKVYLRHAPPLLYGSIEEPACVITFWRPYIILHEEIIRALTNDTLKAVLTHELLHIKRNHTILQNIFAFVCCVHWFNPIIWIGRHEFLSACELDCDRSVINVFDGELQTTSYAKIMVSLMELAAAKKRFSRGTLGLLDFWTAKHRIFNLLNAPSKCQKMIAIWVCFIIILSTFWLSTVVSRSYFYPFGSTITNIEWSAF